MNAMTMEKALLDELSQLNESEKLILAEALWDSIASDPLEVENPEHHNAIIEERLKTLKQVQAGKKSVKNISKSLCQYH